MKKILVMMFALFLTTPAYANDTGAWVKVDATGKAIGQAIVCTPAVCGDPNSLYSQMTLQPGERYVLQTVADANGNVAGIGAGQRGNTEVKVNLQTNEWTATTVTKVEVTPKPTPTVTSEVIAEPTPTPTATTPKIKVNAETTVTERINLDATTTTTSQTIKVNPQVVETPPATTQTQEQEDWYVAFLKEWQTIFDALAVFWQGWYIVWK